MYKRKRGEVHNLFIPDRARRGGALKRKEERQAPYLLHGKRKGEGRKALNFVSANSLRREKLDRLLKGESKDCRLTSINPAGKRGRERNGGEFAKLSLFFRRNVPQRVLERKGVRLEPEFLTSSLEEKGGKRKEDEYAYSSAPCAAGVRGGEKGKEEAGSILTQRKEGEINLPLPTRNLREG